MRKRYTEAEMESQVRSAVQEAERQWAKAEFERQQGILDALDGLRIDPHKLTIHIRAQKMSAARVAARQVARKIMGDGYRLEIQEPSQVDDIWTGDGPEAKFTIVVLASKK
jgi:hypothetical protein